MKVHFDLHFHLHLRFYLHDLHLHPHLRLHLHLQSDDESIGGDTAIGKTFNILIVFKKQIIATISFTKTFAVTVSEILLNFKYSN